MRPETATGAILRGEACRGHGSGDSIARLGEACREGGEVLGFQCVEVCGRLSAATLAALRGEVCGRSRGLA